MARASTRLALVTLLLGLGAVPASAYAASKPDLVVRSVSNPPPSLVYGTRSSITAMVANIGKGRAPGASLAFFVKTTRNGKCRLFLPESEYGGGNCEEIGEGYAFFNGRTRAAFKKFFVPPAVPPGGYYISVCADYYNKQPETNNKNNCRSSQKRVFFRCWAGEPHCPLGHDWDGGLSPENSYPRFEFSARLVYVPRSGYRLSFYESTAINCETDAYAEYPERQMVNNISTDGYKRLSSTGDTSWFGHMDTMWGSSGSYAIHVQRSGTGFIGSAYATGTCKISETDPGTHFESTGTVEFYQLH